MIFSMKKKKNIEKERRHSTVWPQISGHVWAGTYSDIKAIWPSITGLLLIATAFVTNYCLYILDTEWKKTEI